MSDRDRALLRVLGLLATAVLDEVNAKYAELSCRGQWSSNLYELQQQIPEAMAQLHKILDGADAKGGEG